MITEKIKIELKIPSYKRAMNKSLDINDFCVCDTLDFTLAYNLCRYLCVKGNIVICRVKWLFGNEMFCVWNLKTRKVIFSKETNKKENYNEAVNAFKSEIYSNV